MSKALDMEIRICGGTVALSSESSIVGIKIDGEELFYGPAVTLADILRRDRDYMNYINTHDINGRPYDWKASE